MRWKLKTISILISVLGFLHYFLLNNPIKVETGYEFDMDSLKIFHTDYLFIDIFVTNLILCFAIAILGYGVANLARIES